MDKLSNDSLKQILTNAMKKYNCHIRNESKIDVINTAILDQCTRVSENLPEESLNPKHNENNSEDGINMSPTQGTSQNYSEHLENKENAKDYSEEWFMMENALGTIVDFCDGDARKALNCLQSVFELKAADGSKQEDVLITCEDVKNVLMRSVQYDKKGSFIHVSTYDLLYLNFFH